MFLTGLFGCLVLQWITAIFWGIFSPVFLDFGILLSVILTIIFLVRNPERFFFLILNLISVCLFFNNITAWNSAELNKLADEVERGKYSVLFSDGEKRLLLISGAKIALEKRRKLPVEWWLRHGERFSFPLKYPVKIHGNEMLVSMELTYPVIFQNTAPGGFVKKVAASVAALSNAVPADTPKERLPGVVVGLLKDWERVGMSVTATFVK